MGLTEIIFLVTAGLFAGFVGGLVGVGGGLIFAPVLFNYFRTMGVDPLVLAPLTIGSSLFCTFVVAFSSTVSQFQKSAVSTRIMFMVGLSSSVSVFIMTRFVTTSTWYSVDVFLLFFSALLVFVAVRMIRSADSSKTPTDPAFTDRSRSSLSLFVTGSAAGVISSAVGVGGGIILVPIYERIFKMPIHRAVGTSSATIVLITVAGVVGYIVSGWDMEITPWSVGYVELGRSLLLALPAAVGARIGVGVSHRFNRVWLRRSFALLAVIVAIHSLSQVFSAL